MPPQRTATVHARAPEPVPSTTANMDRAQEKLLQVARLLRRLRRARASLLDALDAVARESVDSHHADIRDERERKTATRVV